MVEYLIKQKQKSGPSIPESESLVNKDGSGNAKRDKCITF